MDFDIHQVSNAVLVSLNKKNHIKKYLSELPIPEPFIGNGRIKLIILGQDPTVKNMESRKKIRTVLNLDKKQCSLYHYIKRIHTVLVACFEKGVGIIYRCTYYLSR